jgi:putative oxidoreductase
MTCDKPPPGATLVFPFMAPIYRFGSCISWPMVRIIAGANLVPHGANKLFGWWGGSMEGTAQGFANLGLEPALSLAYLVAFTEFFGGILIVIGLFTRFAAAAATIFLFMAVYVHLSDGFWWTQHGYEYAMLWGVVTLAIFFRGGGALSVDGRLGKEL